MPNYDVAVVGLGAMGSASAYALARRGLRVLGLDAHHPPHRHGSHHGESRIIRKAYYEHPAYVPLLERAFAAWRELEERSGAPLLLRTGGLMIGAETGELVAGVLASARTHGLPHELLSCDALHARHPQFRLERAMVAVWERDAGILHPEACIRAFLEGARAAGAELHYGEAAHEWRCGEHIELVTAAGRYSAGALVLTAGAGMGALVPELAATLRVEPQRFAHFSPNAAGLEHLPIFCLEEPDGAFYYGFPDLGSGCKLGRHHGEADIAELRAFMARRLPQANGALVASGECLYTNTPDFHFLLDRHPRHEQVLVASVCSGHGFKFAPVIGEIVADRVQGRTPPFDLSMFRFRG